MRPGWPGQTGRAGPEGQQPRRAILWLQGRGRTLPPTLLYRRPRKQATMGAARRSPLRAQVLHCVTLHSAGNGVDLGFEFRWRAGRQRRGRGGLQPASAQRASNLPLLAPPRGPACAHKGSRTGALEQLTSACIAPSASSLLTLLFSHPAAAACARRVWHRPVCCGLCRHCSGRRRTGAAHRSG